MAVLATAYLAAGNVDPAEMTMSTVVSVPEISVIVLAYNNRDYVAACLRAATASEGVDFEILFVDNDSHDGSADAAEEFFRENPTVEGRVIRTGENLGCAGGNNLGWRAARAPVLVFLNPDTEVDPDCFARLVAPIMSDSDIGITGAKMYYPGRSILQHAGGIVHPNGMTNHHGNGEEDKGQHDKPRDADYVTGACFAIRADLMRRLNGFDEEYFPAYYEEVDLCLRARRMNQRVVYVPDAVLVHHESVSLGSGSKSLRRIYPRMRIRYLLKNLTTRQIVGWAIPFEIRWMLHEPAARGYRWEQVRGWLEAVPWVLRLRR